MNLAEAAHALQTALELTQSPVAICFHDTTPEEPPFQGRVAAGCAFWQAGVTGRFATHAADHSLCAIGQYTHGLEMDERSKTDLGDALRVFSGLGYVRAQDLPLIPVLQSKPKYIVYSPLAQASRTPDLVLLFVRADQQLILSEATQQVEGGNPPAMGRPACAIVPQTVNSGRAALSLGCCGARVYVGPLTSDYALYAIPGSKLDAYVERIVALAAANRTLAKFHALRRDQVVQGQSPSIADSLAALQAQV